MASRRELGYNGAMTTHFTETISPDRRLCVAPMMDWTDRHCRHFHRHIAPDALLFTEMVTADAVLHGDCDRLLGQAPQDVEAGVPVALQLGGSDPGKLAEATRLAAGYGYVEINLNVGCPSDRVQSGRFGACLMAEPALVADCVAAMSDATGLPVTVKCRIGIDDMDPEAGLDEFVDAVADAGVGVIYLHARKAWLNGLSPKENRDIPPLDYGRAARLAARRPDLEIILNGGLDNAGTALAEKSRFAGLMLGRAAYRTPMILAELAESLTGAAVPSRRAVAGLMADYADSCVADGVPLHAVTRHMLGLYHGQRGAKLWRRRLGEEARDRRDGGALIRETAASCEELATRIAA